MDKQAWLNTMIEDMSATLSRLQADIDALHDSRQSDTKSSAGDKHETGRAMVDQELGQLNQLREKTQRSLAELKRLPIGLFDSAQLGAGVEVERMVYFISVSAGKVPTSQPKPVYALSPISPAGQAMLGKRVGERFELNGVKHVIQAIY